jgi:putative membrane-bound dehydrogenase-like protein
MELNAAMRPILLSFWRFPVRIALVFSLAILLLPNPVRAQRPVMEPGPKSPADSLACLKPRPGFTAELMAAEPLVMSPIAFAWGPDGKFWVVEMGDYPLGLDGKNKSGGKVKFLEKSKADGPYDKATLFLDNLGYPTGVTPWGKGVIVTCAPDIFYAEDTDGDGIADKKTVLFTGFKEGNPQHRVNGLVWGLDNWLYGANGDSGGAIKSIKTGAQVNISGRDFRIKPDEGLIEAVSGPTQFGRARDDWGNWFGNNNSAPMYHFVLEDRYLKRNPHVLYPDVRVQVSDKPGASQVYPISKPLPRFNNPQSVNHFTSACSAIVYRDNLFGPDFTNNTFVSEPVHNLVHREIMKPKGVTFTSTRAADEQTSEFLASSDNWFRPTTIQTGPDGALWVADMYRYVIEHPEWIPKDWQKKLDLRAGDDKGRIYRIFPEGKKPREIPRLDKMSPDELVKALDSPSGWQRDTVQRLLVGKDYKVVEPLRKLFRESDNPLARLHAMSALYGLRRSVDALNATRNDLERFLLDKHPGVRANAIRLGQRISGNFIETVLNDPNPHVCMQLAYTLGTSPGPETGASLGRIFADHQDDRYLTAAVLSSVHERNWPPFFATILQKNAIPANAQTNLMKLVAIFGTPEDKVNFLVNRVDQQKGKSRGEEFVMLANLLDGLETGKASLAQWLNATQEKNDQAKLAKITDIMRAARTVIADPKGSVGEKALAIRILGRDSAQWDEDRKTLSALLVPQVEEDVQMAAVQSMGKMIDIRTPGVLLKPWKGYSPALRSQVLGLVLGRLEWTRIFMDALEKKEVLPTELDAIRRQQLLQHKDNEVRQRAEKLLAAASNPDRNKVVMQYVLSVPAKGDADLGKKIFAKNCAACHQLGGIGQQVGPDLASVPDKSLEGLVTAILDPNRVVEARYVNYLATTKTGLTLSGVLFGETTTSITLVAADGKKHELLRRDLEELASTGKSPMPEGLEKEIAPRDMADLIEFLRSGIPSMKPKQFEGNLPQTVRPDAKGILKLLPKNGAIFGKSLTLENKHGNLGYWSSEDDHVVWTLEVPASGVHAVELEWACADDSAGNTLIIQVGERKIVHKVAGTGTWDDYRVIWIATTDLPQGRVEATVRSRGPIRGALIDLKGIYLVPKK